MINDPELLVLDEPSEGLDLNGRTMIRQLANELRDKGRTVLLVSHDHELVDEVATRIWSFDGREIEDFRGPYAEYLSQKDTVTA